MKILNSVVKVGVMAALVATSSSLYAGGKNRDAGSGVTGSLTMLSPDGLSSAVSQYGSEIYPVYYGDRVVFEISVDGKLSKNSRVYVTVICAQAGEIVYQASNWSDYTFYMQDLEGQGLDWNGESADCSATLVYREEKGREAVLNYLATTEFFVN